MVKGVAGAGKLDCFAPTPWTEESEGWLAQGTRDVGESEPVRWLLFGMEPSRACFYDFRDRIAPFLSAWNAQVLGVALAEKMTPATRVALDSTSVAAHAVIHFSRLPSRPF